MQLPVQKFPIAPVHSLNLTFEQQQQIMNIKLAEPDTVPAQFHEDGQRT
jgi:hypothetical protein